MPYNTGNPVPSTDARDFMDNVQNTDVAANTQELTWTDRLGVARKTFAGMEKDFTDFLAASGFEPEVLEYVDGSPLTVLRPTQLIERSAAPGILYAIKLPSAFPVTLSGIWTTDEAELVIRVDDSLRPELASSSGSAQIGHLGRTVRAKLDEAVSVKDFGAIGDGVTDDTAAVVAARDSAVSAGRVLYFPSGNYALSALDLGFSGLKVHCEATATLTHTGTGKFITFDAGTGLEGYFYDIHLTGYPTLQGNLNTTDLIYIRSSHHMLIDVRARDCDCAVRVDFSVLSRIYINHSVNQAPFSIKTPVNTLVMDKRTRVDAAVEPTTACDVWVVSEGVSGAGLLFEYAQVNHVLGGTSEGNGIGIDVKPNSSGNRFDAVFMEANSVKDISDASSYTEYNNCYAGSAVGSIVGSGYKRRFVGGYIKSLVIDSPAGFTRLVDVNLTGSFADNSINTIRDGCHALGSAISDRPNGVWKAHKGGGDQGGISSAVWTKVTFGSEVEDSLGIYDAASSSVTPMAGCYELTAAVSIKAGVVDSGIYGVAIFKNGARIAEMLQHASGVNQISVTVTCQDRTDGSGVYEVYAYGNGAGLKTIGGHPAESWFCGKFLLQ